MSGKLDKFGMSYVQKLINKGPKAFELLYSFTNDGCNSSIFHQKCDNQGPTVTVLYNTDGSVYGGYANVGWASSSGCYKTDTDAFLFTLKLNNKLSLKQFSLKPGHEQYAIIVNSSYGPLFGKGHDMFTFRGSLSPADGVYTLNEHSKFSSYDAQGLNLDMITNGILTVTELEVYKVVDCMEEPCFVGDVPWRTFDLSWDDEHLASLKDDVRNLCPSSEVSIKHSNILMLGPVGAGKSSFINTIASVFRDKMSRLAISGSDEESITSKYRMYAVHSRKKGDTLNFRLWDTRGLEESNGIDSLEMNYILAGNVPNGYQFNPSIPISPDSPGFKKNPSSSDCIHCVCLVVDGTTVDVIPEKMLERIKSLQRVANMKGVPLFVLVTKIDKVSPLMETNLRATFSIALIRDLVDKVAQVFGVPRYNVLPTKNYESEMTLKDDVSTLALLNLKQILMGSEDFIDLMDEVHLSEPCTLSESIN